VGTSGKSAAGGQANAVRLSLRAGRRLPGHRQDRGTAGPHLNTDIVNVLFDQLAREIDPNVHVVLIWDHAGYHTAAGLKVRANVTGEFAAAFAGTQSGGEPVALTE
jgi:hypothetical protein